MLATGVLSLTLTLKVSNVGRCGVKPEGKQEAKYMPNFSNALICMLYVT